MLQEDDVDGVIIAVEVDDAARFGRLEVNRNGRLARFREKQPGRGVINAGTYFLKRRLLDQFPRGTPLSMETQVFPALIEDGAQSPVRQ